MSEHFECPRCGKRESLWEDVTVPGWRAVDDRLAPNGDLRADWAHAQPDGTFGCGECNWEGLRRDLRHVVLGIDGKPLPEIHPRQEGDPLSEHPYPAREKAAVRKDPVELGIYVPAARRLLWVAPASGIVGSAWPRRERGALVFDVEGAIHGQANIRTYGDRLNLAAGRHVTRSPTRSRLFLSRSTDRVIRVGTLRYQPAPLVFEPELNVERLEALMAWLAGSRTLPLQDWTEHLAGELRLSLSTQAE